MKLFRTKRQYADPVIPPELEPYYGSSNQGFRERLSQYKLPLLIGLIVLIGLIAGLVWFMQRDNPTTPTRVRVPAASDQMWQNNGTGDNTSKPAPAKTPASDSTNSTPVEQPGAVLPSTGG